MGSAPRSLVVVAVPTLIDAIDSPKILTCRPCWLRHENKAGRRRDTAWVAPSSFFARGLKGDRVASLRRTGRGDRGRQVLVTRAQDAPRSLYISSEKSNQRSSTRPAGASGARCPDHPDGCDRPERLRVGGDESRFGGHVFCSPVDESHLALVVVGIRAGRYSGGFGAQLAFDPHVHPSGISILQHAPSDANISSTVPPSS